MNPILVNLDVANGILGNVSSRCESLGSSLSSDLSITATPTTTYVINILFRTAEWGMAVDSSSFSGPYYTSWTSGQSLNVPEYTGLTQYTSGLDFFTATRVTTIYPAGAQTPASGQSIAVSNAIPQEFDETECIVRRLAVQLYQAMPLLVDLLRRVLLQQERLVGTSG